MTSAALYNDTQQMFVAMRVTKAHTFWLRFKGWMGKATFREGEALLLTPCRSIHTFFMRAPIDVLYLDRQLRVVGYAKSVKPFRIPKADKRTSSVLELPSGTLAKCNVQILDQLRFI